MGTSPQRRSAWRRIRWICRNGYCGRGMGGWTRRGSRPSTSESRVGLALVQRRRETGEIVAAQQTKFRGRIVAGQEDRLVALITARPDATLAELRTELPTTAALSTLWRTIDGFGFTVKKTVHADEQRRPMCGAPEWQTWQPIHDMRQYACLGPDRPTDVHRDVYEGRLREAGTSSTAAPQRRVPRPSAFVNAFTRPCATSAIGSRCASGSTPAGRRCRQTSITFSRSTTPSGLITDGGATARRRCSPASTVWRWRRRNRLPSARVRRPQRARSAFTACGSDRHPRNPRLVLNHPRNPRPVPIHPRNPRPVLNHPRNPRLVPIHPRNPRLQMIRDMVR